MTRNGRREQGARTCVGGLGLATAGLRPPGDTSHRPLIDLGLCPGAVRTGFLSNNMLTRCLRYYKYLL